MIATGLRSVALGLVLMSSGAHAASISYNVDQITGGTASVTRAIGNSAASFRIAFAESHAWVVRHRPGFGQYVMRDLYWTNTDQIMNAIRGIRRAESRAQLRRITRTAGETVELAEPGSLTLLGFGFALLILLSRRRESFDFVRA